MIRREELRQGLINTQPSEIKAKAFTMNRPINPNPRSGGRGDPTARCDYCKQEGTSEKNVGFSTLISDQQGQGEVDSTKRQIGDNGEIRARLAIRRKRREIV
jgi:hypothetical protein